MINVRSASSGSVLSGSSVTAPRPAGTQAGDVLFACQTSAAPFVGVPAPSGWTATAALDDEVFGDFYTRVWRRTAGTSESGSYVFPQGDGAGTLIVVAVEGADLQVAARVAVREGLEEPAFVVTPGVTPAAATHLEVRFAVTLGQAFQTVTLAPPAGYVLRGTAAMQGHFSAACASRQLSSSSPSGEKNFVTTGENPGGTHGITISIPGGSTEPEVPPIPADAPGQGDALYSYRFSRLFGGFLGTLDLAGVSFEKRISRRGQINSGNFSASYPMSNEAEGDLVAQIVPRNPADLLRGPGVTVVDIWRAGDHWGRYWIIGAKVTKQRRQKPVLQLSGVTMEAYLQYVELEETLGPFTSEDRVEIARQLITHMQAQEHADIGLILAPGSSGSAVTRTYEAHRGKYGGHVADTTSGLDGYEWMINTQLGAGGVELHWKWGKPLGNPNAKHTFTDSPGGGEILDYGIDMTPLTRGTRWRARGDSVQTDASTPSTPLLSAPYSSPHLATGVWPRLDRTVDRPGVTDLAALNAAAEQLAATSGGAPHVFSITVLLGEEPSIRPNLLGDSARIVIADEWFKRVNGGAGLNEKRRILGMRVTPTGREQGRDEAELYIDDQEVE
ncbi:hypothetical protein GCM10017673_15020 [Streptosporangium violaceochromogenes]|nr:hypothetical protein GCM10017673_15020 [Streptosporangium violaceochromogenes]